MCLGQKGVGGVLTHKLAIHKTNRLSSRLADTEAKSILDTVMLAHIATPLLLPRAPPPFHHTLLEVLPCPPS